MTMRSFTRAWWDFELRGWDAVGVALLGALLLLGVFVVVTLAQAWAVARYGVEWPLRPEDVP